LPATSFKSWELLLLDAILLWGQMRAMRRHLSLHKTCDSKQTTYSMVEEGFRKFFPPVPASMYVIREKVWVVCAKQREGQIVQHRPPRIDPFSLQQMYHYVCHIRKKTGGWKFYQSTNSTRGRKRVEFQQSQKGL
jgi:hypothetical protein